MRFDTRLAWFVWLLALLSTAAAAQTPDFNRDDYPSSPGTRAIVKGDFDGNGWTDVALANTGRNTVALLMNVQDGNSGYKFWKTYEWAVGIGPFDLAAGDFNRDGVTDLAVANADGNTLSIMIGAKSGTMSISSIAAPGNPRGIETADIDRDGKPDLIYTAYQQNIVTVLFGDGAGRFTSRFPGIAVGPQPQGVVAGDFNNDGRTDLAIANAGGGLSVLTGDGTGQFTKKNVAGTQNLNVLAAGDLNHDGWLDIAAASQSSGAIGVYLGSAAGLSLLKTVYPSGAASPRGITIADINHDGWPEILAANRASNTVSVVLGAPATSDMYSRTFELAAGAGSRDVVTADFNHDGLLDIAAGNETSGTTTIFTNVTHLDPGAFAFDPVTIGGKENDCQAGSDRLVAADFNNNGAVDLATSIDSGHGISVMLDGKTEQQFTLSGIAGLLRTADLNRDGKSDLLLVASATDSSGPFDLLAYLGDGHGSFTAIRTNVSPVPGSTDLQVADVNRDGMLDAVLLLSDYTTESSQLKVMLGRGDGTFTPGASVPLPALSTSVTLADTNADGKIDAVITGYTGRVTTVLFRGDGSGGFTFSYDFNVYGDHVMTGDVNEDGAIDVLITTWQKVHVFAGLKSGGFAADVVHTGWDAQELADMDGDGHLDLVGQVDDQSIAFGRGNRIWEPQSMFSLGIFGDTMLVTDYNRDGLPDLLFTRFTGYHAMINTRRTVNRPPTVSAGPDLELPYDFAYASEEDYEITANGKDPDSHALTYEWRNEQGQIVSREQYLILTTMPYGPHRFNVTAYDGRGGSATDEVVITIVPTKEIVLYAQYSSQEGTTWRINEDPTAADGNSIYDPNRNAPKAAQALASPQNFVDIWFFPDPTQTYKLWIRGKAENNSWANDSAFIQFTGAVDSNNNPAWQIGTTSALVFNLEECSGCGVSGWGWEDDGWGAVNKNGTLLRFPQGGSQRIRIQTREDGLSIDQIVLSAEKYLTARPGPAKNDKTILPRTQ